MAGETNLDALIKGMTPTLNEGDYVFVSVKDVQMIDRSISLCEFKEKEGTTIVLEKTKADALNLSYDFIANWITLKIHSSLDAVGLTAIFATELARHNISCNVIAGYYHDHIFVDKKDAKKAVDVLTKLSENCEKTILE
jgi:hypothetical protein